MSAPVLSLYVRETSALGPSLNLTSCITIASSAQASVNAMGITGRPTAPGYFYSNYHSDSVLN